MNKHEKNRRKTTENLFQLLKENGAMTAKQLSEILKMTTMGVRQHLQLLEENEELAFFDQKAPRGRPTRFWKLTEKANSRFEDRHEELTVQLLISVREVFGEQGLDKLISQREQAMLSSYQQAMQGAESIEARLIKLVELRSAEGYMASVEQQDGSWWFLENHCPICAAAVACVGFCRSELEIFQQLFTGLASISREEHIVEGARRCAYQVKPL
ncbi:helix-turn-helix transcriptional regulator [Psychromonas ossibalaenae]|uniref:helix-turn-helix transcriptional regulator n=1 Tax=Psychromonas ossibalaenae TaxID=444922 RepID=UPI00047585E1|nr:metalloregulator ArsR/SmtB family transcription factor [Psychromonas ossibalaenae]